MILFLLSMASWMKEKELKRSNLTVETPSKNLKPSLKKSQVIKSIMNKCPNIQFFTAEHIVVKEELARNIHYKRDRDIFRIRIFLEDGSNNTYQKLVKYKEDKEGFPRIIHGDDTRDINPTEVYIKSLSHGGEVIHKEMDYRYELEDGREITISEINGEIVKLDSPRDKCFFEK